MTGAPGAGATPRVLSYPPRHDYVDRLHPHVARLVHRDEPWPGLDNLYDPSWVRRHQPGWDVAHLHFTWEQHPLDRVAAVLDAHRDAGRPVVWTAHDLRNPHTGRPEEDDAYLALLADRADAVITLTPGARSEVAARFGRDAEVVPHGPVLDPATADGWRARRRRPGGRLHLLVHGKSLRAGMDWRAAVSAVRRLAGEGEDLRLDLLVHAHADERPAVEAAAGGPVHVIVHEPLPMAELCRLLVGVDALVLPYRWGTHSGLVELAADLAVPVIAADVGYLREQGPAIVCPAGEEGLAAGIRQLLEGRPPAPVPLEDRAGDLSAFRRAHAATYAALR